MSKIAKLNVPSFQSWILGLKNTSFDSSYLPKEFFMFIEGKQVGSIVPFTFNDLVEDDKICKLVKWRNAHYKSFISNQKVDFYGTRTWLGEQILENANRELFWVLNENMDFIGHIGILYDEVHSRFEFDNILRGGVSAKGLIRMSMKIVEDSIHKKFNADQIFLRVLKKNTKAILFYRRNGFKELTLSNGISMSKESIEIILMVKNISK